MRSRSLHYKPYLWLRVILALFASAVTVECGTRSSRTTGMQGRSSPDPGRRRSLEKG